MNTIIESALFRNAIVFLNEAIHHFNLGINQYDNKILAIVDLQMSLELSIKFSIANNFSINDIFDEKNIKGLSETEIISSYQSNKLKVKEFEQLKNFLKSDRYFCTEFSSDFSYMEKFQKYRNKLVHQNYNFSEEEEKTIENDIIHIIVYILYRLLSNDVSSSDYNDYLYEYIPKKEYENLLLNEKFAKEIKLKFETEYGKLYTCPLCGSKSLTPMKKCYRCLEHFEDGFSYGYVKCAYCGKDYVIFDAGNMDCNKGYARGWCLNGHLSKSEPPRFGQRQMFCYNPFYNAVLRLLNLDFKMDTKIKTAQNRIVKMKKSDSEPPASDLKCKKSVLLKGV